MRGATAARRSLQDDVGGCLASGKGASVLPPSPLTLIPLPSLGGRGDPHGCRVRVPKRCLLAAEGSLPIEPSPPNRGRGQGEGGDCGTAHFAG